MRLHRILFLLISFTLGMLAGAAYNRHTQLHAAKIENQNDDLKAIDRLHKLDEQVTLLNDPKALQSLWTDDAVRLNPDGSADIGKAAIYAADARAFAAPGFSIVSYQPQVKDVQIAGPWAFEWGSFTAGYHPSTGQPVQQISGHVLRILNRENSNDWKFARIMVSVKTP